MRLLVTGASGFLGHALSQKVLAEPGRLNIRQLLVAGRRPEALADLERQGAKVLVGDLCQPGFAQSAVADVDAVVHCAGLSGLGGPLSQYSANTIGTENLLRACLASKAKKFVNVGTPSIYFDYTDRLQITENDVPSKLADNYAISKYASEKQLLDANNDDFWTMSLRPRFTSGSGDTNILPRFIALQQQGALKQIGSGNNLVDFTAISNMVQAFEKALIAPQNAWGQAYNITNGDPVSLWPFLRSLMAKLELGEIKGKVPPKLAMNAGALSERVARLRNKQPQVTKLGAALACTSMTMSIEAARKNLGYEPLQSNESMLDDFVAYWQSTHSGN